MRNVHQEIKSTVVWIVLTTLLALAGIWQAKVTVARQLQASHQPLPPPLKTRAAIRPPPKVFAGDVVEDYIARCNKGLTDREIGWIVEDFRNAGLTFVDFTYETTDDEIVAYRVAQQRWYFDALKDGLRLTALQSSEAARNLDDIRLKVTSEFRKDRKAETESEHPNSNDSRFDLVLSPVWLFLAYGDESPSEFRFMPWDLCTLTTGQSGITRIRAFFQHNAPLKSQPRQPSGPALEQSFLNKLPFENDMDLPEMFAMADAVFPYLKSQKFIVAEDADTESPTTLLENTRHLHPAQLKMMLLFYPQLAGEIQSALNKANP